MYPYILRRLGQAAITLLIVTVVTFVLIALSPGGFVIESSAGMSAEDMARIRSNLGLDQPLPVQYLRWATGLARGDLGRSLINGQPVLSLIGERLPNTAQLAALALLITIVVGIPLGLVCAVRAYSWVDNLISGLSFVGIATPIFWLGMLLILLFSVQLKWLPSSGLTSLGGGDLVDRLKHFVMPALVLAASSTPQILRFTRSSLLEVLSQDYLRTARAKGLREWRVLSDHALRNALIPVITLLGLQLPRLVGGAVVTETVFGWPGIGSLAVTSAFRGDYPVILGITIVVSVAVLASSLVVDLLYAVVNPRIALE
ncbi:MAG TPA: ABC transporter permease [Chloroflexota bacterium]|jgi:peptide/nickel transport system permease protein